jgi:hypothetical protein
MRGGEAAGMGSPSRPVGPFYSKRVVGGISTARFFY